MMIFFSFTKFKNISDRMHTKICAKKYILDLKNFFISPLVEVEDYV